MSRRPMILMTIPIKTDPYKVKRGHAPHRSGAGAHTPKPRKGHRGQQCRDAIRDHS